MAIRPAGIIRLLCFGVLLCMAALQLRYSVIEQEIFAGARDETGATRSRDAKLLTNLGKEKHLFEADLNGATHLLQQALLANPFYVPAWLALAVVQNDQGKKQQSYQILDYTNYLTTDLKRWRWDEVLTAYQLGRSELLPTELSYIIAQIPGKSRNAALQLAFTRWPEPAELLENIGPENLPHLYRDSIRSKNTACTISFHKEMEKVGMDIEHKDLLAAITMLMNNGEAAEAAAIWRRTVNPESLLFNGSFEHPFMQKAFGWRRSKHPSVAVTVDRTHQPPGAAPDAKALHLRFKGWDNLNYYHLSQIVPLDSTSYQLTGWAKTQKLTTDQHPYLEVYGYQCTETQFKYEKTDMFPATRDWVPVELDFSVPDGCEAAVVRLRRNQSHQIDSKISGHLWLADLRITETGTAETVPE